MNNQLKILFILLLVSCNNDVMENESSFNLEDCKTKYLFFNDGIRFTDNNFAFFELDSIVFNYQNQKISKVIGGFELYDPLTSYNNKMLTNSIYDSIIKSYNTYKVYSVPPRIYYFTDNPENAVEYMTDNNKIQKITRRDGLVLNYFYENDLILEKNENNLLLRKFYLENHNLTKVEILKYDWSMELASKTEIIFQEYDAYPNPLKDKYYLLGAFYRSFSENNYRSYTVNSYNRLVDGSYELYDTHGFSAPFGYNDDHYPLYGNYN